MDRCVLVCLSLSVCASSQIDLPSLAFIILSIFFLQFNFIERFIRSEFDFSIIASISQIKRIYVCVYVCVSLCVARPHFCL